MNVVMMLLDLLFPRRCAGCSVRGPAWCSSCDSSVEGLFAVRRGALGVPAFALASYGGPVRRLVLAYKERGRRELADPIGLLLAAAVPRVLARAGPAGADRCWLVAAPSRPAAIRRRGGNHVELAVRRAARALGAASGPPVRRAARALGAASGPAVRRAGRGHDAAGGVAVEVGPVLRVGWGVRDSVGLRWRERRANLRGRVRVRGPRPPSGAPVLLVDDVITTGATAAACVDALHAAGVEVTAVLALTATT